MKNEKRLEAGMSEAPERIWVSAPCPDNECQVWTDPDEGGTEYVLAHHI